MRRRLIAIGVLCFGFFAAQFATRPNHRDPIEGIWILTSAEWQGEVTSQEESDIDLLGIRNNYYPENPFAHISMARLQSRLSLFDGKFVWCYEGKGCPYSPLVRDTGSYQVDVRSTPNVLELQYDFSRSYVEEMNWTTLDAKKDRLRCIVSVEKDMLRTGWWKRGEGKVPDSFDTAGKKDVIVRNFRRLN